MLGPFWLTTSMAVMVIALGVLYAELFRTPVRDFMPYLCVGMLIWWLTRGLRSLVTMRIGFSAFAKPKPGCAVRMVGCPLAVNHWVTWWPASCSG